MDHVIPAIPPVRPRVAHDGDDRPLDEVVEELLADDVCGIVELAGEPGSGKTTALSLLAARFGAEPKLMLVDNPSEDELKTLPTDRLCIVASRLFVHPPASRLPLASWGADQMIEYLLDVRPEDCRSVMTRLAASQRRWPPYLAIILIERFASNPSARDAEAEICAYVRSRLKPKQLAAARKLALAMLTPTKATWLAKVIKAWIALKVPLEAHRTLLVHRMVQISLACDALATSLATNPAALPASLSRELATNAGLRCRDTVGAIDALRQLIVDQQHRDQHPTIASLLAMADPTWIPPTTTARPYHFANASFHGVKWTAADLREADLSRTDFSDACLKFARLTNCRISETNFSGANLNAADMMRSCGQNADFTTATLAQANLSDGEFLRADFENANLNDAQLSRCNLREANFAHANLGSADLSAAILVRAALSAADLTAANLQGANLYAVDLRTTTLTNAILDQANLSNANLEDVRLPEAKLRGARLDSAQLTGSSMPRACLKNASLIGAKLAEIDWEGVDLRKANLRGATFHLGSSRSGLVNSLIALEGNMTGFYNDDFEDRTYKRPEEIRKANLRSADLRGAKLAGVNLYLVDLRDARLDPDALQHARNCGAILEDVPAA